MKREVLLRSMLFCEIPEADLDKLLHCLRAETRRYAKGGPICRAGEQAAAMGLVLSGGVNIENDDIWGNRTILDHVAPGQVFAEAYACAPGEPLQVSATAAEETEVLFLQAGRLLKPCSQGCAQHSQLLRNLLVISAQKNSSCPAGCFTPLPRPFGGGSNPIFRIRRSVRAAGNFRSPSTVSSWPTIWESTGAPCPMS